MAIEGGKALLSTNQIKVLNFDFTNGLDKGQTIQGNVTFDIIQLEGNDAIHLGIPPTELDDEGNTILEVRPEIKYWFPDPETDPDTVGVPQLYQNNVSDPNRIRTLKGIVHQDVPVNNSAKPDDPSRGKIVSIHARAVRTNESEDRSDGALDSIWEVVCRVKTTPGGYADSGSMIVVGAG